jgi:hypothetical protein
MANGFTPEEIARARQILEARESPLAAAAQPIGGSLVGGPGGLPLRPVAAPPTPQSQGFIRPSLARGQPVATGPVGAADVAFGAQPATAQAAPGLRLPRGASVRPIADARAKLAGLGEEAKATADASRARLQEAGQGVREAIGFEAEALRGAAEAEAGILKSGAAAFQQVAQEEGVKVQQAESNVRQTMDEYRAELAKLSAAKVDPRRLFTTGGKIGAAIAMALGSFGAALAGGRNTAFDIIQATIQRDISAQESAIAKQRGVVGAKQAEIGMARDLFSDAKSQKLAAENALLTQVNQQIGILAAESKSDTVMANAEKLIAQSNATIAANENKIAGDMLSNQLQAATTEATVAGQEVAARQRNVGLTQAAKLAELKASAKGAGGRPVPASAIAKVSDFRAGEKLVDQLEGTWDDLMRENAFGALGTLAPKQVATAANKWDVKALGIAQSIGKKLEGRMTDEDFKRFLALVPRATDTNETADFKIEQMRAMLGAQSVATIEGLQATGHDVAGLIDLTQKQAQIEKTGQQVSK